MTSFVRGEMKTPGGKLVAVEFRVEFDQLTDVMITGDFFLYPEEALPLLTASLEGAHVAAGEAGFKRAVEELLDRKKNEITLVGTSPEAIATAVSRALATVESE